mmetsp:Transcript_45937/g.129251  ORF Transcript_45937/g.129251 Transcript_45937/m.129251 type:complete len:122 (+) Transcript_45937:38-403(+)
MITTEEALPSRRRRRRLAYGQGPNSISNIGDVSCNPFRHYYLMMLTTTTMMIPKNNNNTTTNKNNHLPNCCNMDDPIPIPWDLPSWSFHPIPSFHLKSRQRSNVIPFYKALYIHIPCDFWN